MHHLQIVSALLGLSGYVWLIVLLLKIKDASQSFASYLLWAALEIILVTATIFQDGNYYLQLAYVVGGSITAIILFLKKQRTWGNLETFVSILVAMCLIIWLVVGDRVGIVASSLAIFIASVPQFKHTAEDPDKTHLGVWWLWTAGNACSLLAGKDWSIEERFFPSCALLGGLITLGIVYWKKIKVLAFG